MLHNGKPGGFVLALRLSVLRHPRHSRRTDACRGLITGPNEKCAIRRRPLGAILEEAIRQRQEIGVLVAVGTG